MIKLTKICLHIHVFQLKRNQVENYTEEEINVIGINFIGLCPDIIMGGKALVLKLEFGGNRKQKNIAQRDIKLLPSGSILVGNLLACSVK